MAKTPTKQKKQRVSTRPKKKSKKAEEADFGSDDDVYYTKDPSESGDGEKLESHGAMMGETKANDDDDTEDVDNEEDEEENVMNVASNSSLCPKGVWMTEEDFMKCHGIKEALMKLWRCQTCPATILPVHGSKVKAPMPYEKFHFVFIAPKGTSASLYPITLRDWSRMCEYFSNTVNTVIQTDDKVDKSFRVLFEKYTNGTEATPANIAKAFEEGVMKHSSKLVPLPKKVGRPKNTTTTNTTTTNNNNNNNKKKSAENQKENKMREETVNDLLPSEERLTNVVVNRYKQLEEKDVARDKELSKIGALMKMAEIDSLKFKFTRSRKSAAKVEVNMIFTVCKCGRNRVNQARKNQSTLCKKCSTKQSIDRKNEQRRRDNALQRVAADSVVPISTLSPEEITIRMHNMNRERHRKEQERKRLLEKVEKLTEERDNKKARSESEEFKL